jgi:hypothetical protein
MDLKETEAENDCADEDQQKFNGLTDWVVQSIRGAGDWCEVATTLVVSWETVTSL